MGSDAAMLKLDDAVAAGCQVTRNLKASFAGALQVARVAQQIRLALTPEMVQELIMPLKECDFGWRTDGKVYSLEEIRDCWVDAALKGAVPINNEVNIISKKAYMAKNYFKRMLREYPGLTDLVTIPGKLTMSPSGALVEYSATWKMNGKPQQYLRVKESAIPVRLNNGMGADGAIGKAERKLLCGVLTQITGSTLNGDDDFDEISLDDLPIPMKVTATERKEPAMPQNVLPEPTAAKAGTVQTKATTEKIKKKEIAKIPDPTPEAPSAETGGDPNEAQSVTSDGEAAPWETGADNDGDAENQSSPVASADQTSAVAAPATEPTAASAVADTKVVGWIKNNETGQMDEVRKAKTDTKKKVKEEPPKTGQGNGSGEIEMDHPGKIVFVKSKDQQKNPPYTVTTENSSQYITNDLALAKKANDLKTKGVPVEIEYTRDESGRYMIVEVRPDGSKDQINDEAGQEM